MKKQKSYFPAKCKHFPNSCKSPSKTQIERILQTALLGLRLPKGVESASRLREWEARCFSELRFEMPEWMGENAVWKISASKTKTEQPNRTAFNVCVQLTELNWCVFAGVSKPFLWRRAKRIFPAKCKHFTNSWKSPSKTQKQRILQTALLGVRSAKGVESAFRIREWEARFFQELCFVIPGWMGANAILRNICF